MAVVKMNKFTILTFEGFKNDLLKHLQIFEGVHFKDLQDSDDLELTFLKKDNARERVVEYESEVSKIKFVEERIKPFVEAPKGLKAYTTVPVTMSFDEFEAFAVRYDHNKIYDEVKNLDEQFKAIKTEKNKLKNDSESLNSWLRLDTSTKELDRLKNCAYFVGVVNKTPPEQILDTISKAYPSAFFEIINSDKDETAILLIVPANQGDEAFNTLKSMNFSKASLSLVNVPAEQIAANERKTAELTEKEESLKNEIAKYASENQNLSIALDYYKTVLERYKACDNFLTLDNVVIIEGWTPEEDFTKLEQILTNCCGKEYYVEKEVVASDSIEVPIKLKNNKIVSAFESITSMYSLPRYNEFDPTPLLTPFYILFFGLMIGDIGYGLLLLIGTLFAKRLNLAEGVKNFMGFLNILSISVIGAGILYGSAFGFAVFTPIPSAETETGYKAILDSGVDITTMIIVSVIIGVVHVLFGVLVKGYALLKEGKVLDAIYDSVFWFFCVLSGLGWLVGAAGFLPANIASICMWVFWATVIGLILTQGRENKTIATKLAGGLFGVYGLTSYVGDIVSYTRIIALALSGAYIAMSFNIMAGLMPNPLLKFTASVVIFVFGQTLNLGLGVLGAYVHTCRLQYVEYFGKFYEGGGKPFKPLKLMNQFIKIK